MSKECFVQRIAFVVQPAQWDEAAGMLPAVPATKFLTTLRVLLQSLIKAVSGEFDLATVYKLQLSNTTEQPILFKITFKETEADAGKVNLAWPINGIKGSLAPSENTTVALLAKILPGETENGGKYELEKLQVSLKWKPDAQKIAKEAPNQAGAQDGAGGSDPQDIAGPAATSAFYG